jgi:hypothetical protein
MRDFCKEAGLYVASERRRLAAEEARETRALRSREVAATLIGTFVSGGSAPSVANSGRERG